MSTKKNTPTAVTDNDSIERYMNITYASLSKGKDSCGLWRKEKLIAAIRCPPFLKKSP